MASRRDAPRRVGDLVPKVHPDPEQLPAAKVFGWWHRAVPARLVAHARPVKLERGVLTVHVSSSSWAQELQFLQERLLGAIRRAAPGAHVRRLRFQVGPLPPLPARPVPEPPEPPRVPQSQFPEDLARALADVPDDDLRNMIARAAAVSLASPDKGGSSGDA